MVARITVSRVTLYASRGLRKAAQRRRPQAGNNTAVTVVNTPSHRAPDLNSSGPNAIILKMSLAVGTSHTREVPTRTPNKAAFEFLFVRVVWNQRSRAKAAVVPTSEGIETKRRWGRPSIQSSDPGPSAIRAAAIPPASTRKRYAHHRATLEMPLALRLAIFNRSGTGVRMATTSHVTTFQYGAWILCSTQWYHVTASDRPYSTMKKANRVAKRRFRAIPSKQPTRRKIAARTRSITWNASIPTVWCMCSGRGLANLGHALYSGVIYFTPCKLARTTMIKSGR